MEWAVNALGMRLHGLGCQQPGNETTYTRMTACRYLGSPVSRPRRPGMVGRTPHTAAASPALCIGVEEKAKG